MTIQKIIDTYNYSTVTGCRLTKAATVELYEAILVHMNMNAEVRIDPMRRNMRTLFVRTENEIPEGFMTFTGYRPKTKSFYSNYSELELLRILFLIEPVGTDYTSVYEATKERIRTTCFGRFCPTGECFEMSVIALRFISAVFPDEKIWIDMYVTNIARTILEQERKVSKRTMLMFCQVLSELRREKDGPMIDEILCSLDERQLHKASKITSDVNACILYSSLRRVA